MPQRGEHRREAKARNEALRREIDNLTEHIAEQKRILEPLRERVEATYEGENSERISQRDTEFWKATFEFFKQYTTIALASLAAFAALLGGYFDNPPDRSESVLGYAVSYAPVLRPLLFDGVRTLCILVTFLGFVFGGVLAIRGMHHCRHALRYEPRVDSGRDSDNGSLPQESGVDRARLGIGVSYFLAIVAFLIVTLSSISHP